MKKRVYSGQLNESQIRFIRYRLILLAVRVSVVVLAIALMVILYGK
jgi:hypothetical protein